MDSLKPLAGLPKSDQTKWRWYLRHAADNGIVRAGVAVKFGREWRIDESKAPPWLAEQTEKALNRNREEPRP